MTARCLAAAALLAAAPVLPAQSWELVWSDEFDGPEIDRTKWNWEVNAWGGGNNELQFYTDRRENSFIEDGQLVIRAIKERYTGVDERDGEVRTRDYTSARLNSANKGDWRYGRIEARAKMPEGQGLWPAIWMLPTDWVYGRWAASGEIDVMEYRGDLPTTLYSTIHFGGEWPNNTKIGGTTTVPDMSQDFHVYALEWEETVMRWYFNDRLVYQTSSWFSTGAPYPAPFDQRFHLLMNVAIGGSFLPNPPADADYFPQELRVDWVRVYQRNDDDQQPWNGEPHRLPGRIQAEHFDVGGSGIAYSDTTQENIGGVFRPDESVDIEPSQDVDGGNSIGWFVTNEWVEYTIEVPEGGDYRFLIRYASEAAGLATRLQVLDGSRVVASLTSSLQPTAGWYTWDTFDADTMRLEPGTYLLRLINIGAEVNVNYIDVLGPPHAGFQSNLWMVQ